MSYENFRTVDTADASQSQGHTSLRYRLLLTKFENRLITAPRMR